MMADCDRIGGAGFGMKGEKWAMHIITMRKWGTTLPINKREKFNSTKKRFH